MFRELGILYKFIKMMNDAGINMLIEAAKDIVSNKKFCNDVVPKDSDSCDLSELDKDFDKVLSMINRPKGCGYVET